MTQVQTIQTKPRFVRDESGSMTVFGLFMFFAVAIVGAIALDFSQLYSSRTHLQILADQTGHAALYQRSENSEARATANALAMASSSAAAADYGNPILAEDIQFGTYDAATDTFTASAGAKDAVRVIARFSKSRGNPAPSYLFRLVGIDNFDIIVESVWQVYYPRCLNEGFIAEGIVDIQSNNRFGRGFCVHSNEHVELQNGNAFDTNTTVSMPDKSEVVSGGFENNPGLEAALKDSFTNLRTLDRLETYRAGLLTGNRDFLPSYITNTVPITVHGNRFDSTDFSPGRVYFANCPGAGLTIDAGTTPLVGAVIITDCRVKFSNGSHLQSSIVMTTSVSKDSFNSPAGLTVGLDDDCAAGGGAMLLTYGGMNFPADLKAFGGTFMARDDIEFSANANGMQGVSMIAGGTISGTSNMSQGSCPDTMDTRFQVPYFRMAR